MTASSLEDVFARPHPQLDQATQQFQYCAYREALTLLLSSEQSVIHSIPAGAGSGKTRLLVALINGLLRCGISSDRIEAISFTNASANDFRRKHIESSIEAPTDLGLAAENICFSTIHQSAMNMLKKLQPHMGGVAYYFEDAGTGAQDDEDEERRRAVRLALYSSVVYSNGDSALLDTLANYADQDEKTFILGDLGTSNHLERARKLIREDIASDAGLGAFTNMAEGGPDYCIAVATDALMRLYNAKIPLNQKRDIYGVPQFLAVDEAQDLDFLQLLMLRALALNGASIILVGDSRQTLYEFRQSLSDYPFLQRFMNDFVKGTDILASISNHALQTNYRCRSEIIEAAEEISKRAVDYSEERQRRFTNQGNIQTIVDPEHIALGKPFITEDTAAEKQRAAITVIIGEPAKPTTHQAPAPVRRQGGALGLLPEFAAPSPQAKPKAKPSKRTPIQSLSGGENAARIRAQLANLYERAKAGETAAIITRVGIRDDDVRFLESLISSVDPEARDRLTFNLISPPKHTPLAEYWFPDSNHEAKHQLPFSSLMVAGALTYILTSDKTTQDRLRIAGRRSLNSIYITPEGIREQRQQGEHVHTIAEELKLFFNALHSKLDDLLPDVDATEFIANTDALRLMVARFTFDVIAQYGRLLWKVRQKPDSHPCRFHQIACEFLSGRYEGNAIRPLAETKGYLKLMWRALASTRFALSELDRTTLRNAGLAPEHMDADTSLASFAQHLNDYCCVKGQRHRGLLEQRERFLQDRETIYDEFSQLWHIKTRTYMREIARCLGREVRANPSSAEEGYRRAVWDEAYQNAKYKGRLTLTYKPDKDQYGGLFADLVGGMKHDAVLQKRNGKAQPPADKIVIDLTTIHSSKGLEWDHVLLYFPQPNARDKDTSFKACRDLIYVAITRAARTLCIVLQKRKKWDESPSDTGIKVFVELMHRWADDFGYYNRELDWGELTAHESPETVRVFDETSHSELERSQTCRMHHYFQDMRRVSTMVPLTPPAYAFFFHSTMSAICAAFINQRLPSQVDPAILISGAVAQIVERRLDESSAYRFLKAQVPDDLYVLMESMIPMYFLGDRTRHHDVLHFYTEAFAHHLAAITTNSQLFVLLKEYRHRAGYRILIEKSMRKVLSGTADGLLPVVGIPDIKIVGPDLIYVADYKTVPRLEEQQRSDDELEAYEQMLSSKTQQQVNYYQGMIDVGRACRYLAEILYVADITLMEHESPPDTCATLPDINQGPNYKVVVGIEHARVLYTDRFDAEQFGETAQQIQTLRETYRNSTTRPEGMFRPEPLVSGGLGEVTADQCRQCSSGVHCPFNKHLNLAEVLA
ncbi:UvrD-helicase domain-containing protein [Pseudomonas sp. D(2018)]|uniref:UvrD-helicase domain-containing protein n=1 Tax=Pseudomonas sp. D(2018) TaxID=2502238 RepID=UPI0010F5A771|nr:UvrD-helicase domain-containing protein [Pseudomonas sp. D(2018)]